MIVKRDDKDFFTEEIWLHSFLKTDFISAFMKSHRTNFYRMACLSA